MQVNDDRLKELLTNVVKNGEIECPELIDCAINPEHSKCFECWTKYLKEQIW